MFVFNYDEEKDLYTINDVDEDNGTSTIVYSFEQLEPFTEDDTTYVIKEHKADKYYRILSITTGSFKVSEKEFAKIHKSIDGFRIVELPGRNGLNFYNEENGNLSKDFAVVCPYVNGKAIVRKNIFSKYYVMDKKFNVLEHGDIHGFDNFYYADGDENFQIIQHTKNSRFYFTNKQGVVSPECYNVKLLSDIDMISYQKDPDSPVLYLDAIGNINESSKYGEMLYKYKTGVKKLEDIPNIYFLNTSFKNAVINFHKEQYNLEVNAKIANDEDVDTEQDKVYLQEFKEYIESRVEKAKEEIKQKEASKAKQDATRKTASDIANSILTTDEN